VSSTAAAPRRARAESLAAPGIVLAAAVLAWLPALGAGFVSDDFVMLNTADAVDGVGWAFTHNDLGGDSDHFYRPLWVLWNAGILELFGDDAGAFHAGNLLLFALISLQVFLLARRLLAPAGALVAGLAFALYPRHGESVAWVSGSTDLLAVAIGLAALLCLLAPWPERRRLLAAAALTAAAALAKEAAFLLPLLGVLLLWARGERSRRELLTGPAVMAAALAAVFVIRTAVLEGLGGYGDDPVGAGRVIATGISYAVAGVSPSQLELLRFPVLLLIPLAVGAALIFGISRLEGPRRRTALAGLAWFALALLPVLGLPLDLNNANGERLMLLPSAGLALAAGALVPERPSRRAALALGAAGLLALVLCLDVGRSWNRAGDLADRMVRQATAIAPTDEPLLVVTLPDSYRSARVFTNSFDVALRRAGRSGPVSWCVPVQVHNETAGAVRVSRSSPPALLAETSWDAPFDYPVLRDPAPLVPGCAYTETGSADTAPGLRLAALAMPSAGFENAFTAYFDGRNLRPLE
jgi:Dolichyl-phosphate-mannose-protein mannosyltransferase